MTDRTPPVLRPEHPQARSLAGLLEEFGLSATGSTDGVEISGVTLSTGDVHPGDLYVGIHGAHSHGASYAAAAREGGAVAILTDPEGAELAADAGLPIVVVASPREALGEISAWVYRTADRPPLLFGTTGTNGKTSTSYLLEGILKQLGLVSGLSSTSERHIGELSVVSRLTTPEASEMHALLARMRESAVRAVAIEVSAQALSRNRVDGVVFDVVAFTNLSHDHLDDYADMEEYFQAKLALFDPERAKRGVVSLDTAWGQRVVDAARIPVTTISATPGVDAEWIVTIVDEHAAYTEFTVTGPEGRSLTTRVPLIGWHMAANAALAIVMLVEAGFELEAIGHALAEDGGIIAYLPGRTERVSGDRGPSVYVDFGHSPDAFLNTLAAVRKFTPGKTIMLFGADGDRDASKRLEMGRIAADGSDILVITDHHPRFENAASIRKVLREGAALAEHQPQQILEVSPPEKAIRAAVALAGEHDSILWAGPGHQDYRDIEGVRTPYSAREEARAAPSRGGLGVIRLSVAEIATIIGGRLVAGVPGDTTVGGSVQTDSRLVEAGSIFFALPGEFTDGSLFAESAVSAGAALVIAEREPRVDAPVIVVTNGVAALAALATEVVARVRAAGRLSVVAITGSNGKTTTKNLLREILGAVGPTVAPQGSFNNHVGAPISMLGIDYDTRYLVVEMGASGAGEIARLVKIAVPDIGIVLKVGLAHVGEFGGIDAVQRAKSEMVTDLPATSVALLNADDDRVAAMAELTKASVRWFGLSESADVRAEDIEATATGTQFTLVVGEQRMPVRLRILGEHHVLNALAALSVARELGLDLDRAIETIETVARAERWRMELLLPESGAIVINDAYNASPDSMAAALKTLAQIRGENDRTIAVLGEMAELGEYSDEEHDRIGRLVVRLNIRKLIVVGHGARHIHNAAGLEGSWDGESVYVSDADEAYDLLREDLGTGDIVLVKSSKSANLRFLGDRIGGVSA